MRVRASVVLGLLLWASPLATCAQVFAQSAEAVASEPLPRIYRFRSPSGRDVFTNVLEQVPSDQRDHAELDLTRVSLNTQIGAELDAKLKAQHAKLIDTPYCDTLRAEAAQPWQVIWRDDAPLLIFGSMLLIFVLITPSMLERFGAAIWMRTLSMAISWLTLAGLMTYGTMRASHTASQLRDLARPCEPSTWQAIATEDQALKKHFDLVSQLQRQTAIVEQIHAESR
jgi:hypothetical protein